MCIVIEAGGGRVHALLVFARLSFCFTSQNVVSLDFIEEESEPPRRRAILVTVLHLLMGLVPSSVSLGEG